MPLSPHAPTRVASRRLAGLAAILVASLALAGCQSPPADDYDPVLAQFFVEVPAQMRDAVAAQLPRSGVQVIIAPRPVITETDVRNVELVKVDLGLCLMFEFSTDGARTLLRLSGSNLGRRLVVALNGKPFGARLLDGPITDGRLLIFVELPDDELTETAVNLKRTAREIQTALAEGRGKKK